MRVKKKRRAQSGCLAVILVAVIAVLAVRGMTGLFRISVDDILGANAKANWKLAAFAKSQKLQLSEWPDELIELMAKNPDTEEFVLQYPLKKDAEPVINLDEYKNSETVPLLFQWDVRWGYSEYGDELMGLSGCGPTCLSMVSIYLLNDVKYNPKYIADFAENNGYSVSDNGSAWSLIYEGGEKLGLDVVEIPLDETRVRDNLDVGNPIICIMGPGDFTATGHFIVLTEYIDGQVKIHDPNSKVRSEQLWNFHDIKNQIRNLWVCRK